MMRKITWPGAKDVGPDARRLRREREYADLAGGKKGRILAMGFSPRKPSLVLYIKHATGWDHNLARLGKHGTGKGCLYINKLADVDAGVLQEMVAAAWRETARV